MNEPVADHGPAAPSRSARARQVWRLRKLSVAVTLKDGPFTRPESCTLAPTSLKTSNRYWSGTGSVNFIVDAVAVSVGRSLTCASLTGDIGTGGVAFSVEPSAAAPVPLAAARALGDVGFAV